MDKIGLRIREYRERAGVSQKKLGFALGLSDKAVSAYESGRTLPPLETLGRISTELKKPLKYFLIDDSEDSTFDDRLNEVEKQLQSILNEVKDIKKNIKK